MYVDMSREEVVKRGRQHGLISALDIVDPDRRSPPLFFLGRGLMTSANPRAHELHRDGGSEQRWKDRIRHSSHLVDFLQVNMLRVLIY